MTREQAKVIAIIGQGYVGLPLAMAAVHAGWRVIGVDTLELKVSQINSGSSPVEDVTDVQLKAAIDCKQYSATSDFSKVAEATVIVICVPTPLNEKRHPDLEMIRIAAIEIAPFISDEALVVSESTSFPGTLRDIILPEIESRKANPNYEIYYASAPERVNPGDTKWTQKNTSRLVGGINSESTARALNFYRTICDSVVEVSAPEIAEAAKLLENTFRLVNIALVNEFAQLCASASINVNEVIDAASTKPYGYMKFTPGIGVGGHCIPVDPLYLTWWAAQNGSKANFVEAADEINRSMAKYVAIRVAGMIKKEIRNPKVLIVGVSYKSGISDTRETPASRLYDELVEMGMEVSWHDSHVGIWKNSKSSSLDSDFHVAIIATAHPDLNSEILLRKDIKILDCTNTLVPGEKVVSL